MKHFILLSILFVNCYVLDVFELSLPESIKGKEARQIITTAALTGTAIASGIEGRVSTDSLLSFFAADLANIKDDLYYDKKDVDQCAADAQFINLVTIKIGGFNCNLTPHKILIDWPVPLF